MGLKEKGADGEKGEGVAASGGGAHDDDDHGGEPGHRSKDEDEVSCGLRGCSPLVAILK